MITGVCERKLHACAQFGGWHGGRVTPLFQTVEIQYVMSPHFFLFRFCIWRGFENESDVCHALCEELLLSDGRPTQNQVDVETEFGVVRDAGMGVHDGGTATYLWNGVMGAQMPLHNGVVSSFMI